jgi:DNA-binding MarR family transcriptional regulator
LSAPDGAPRDFVDVLMASWAASRPDYDVSPMAVATRLARVRDHLEGEMAALFGSYGLTAPTFVMLVTLTRLLGAGEAVTEARVARELGLTEETIGVRLGRLAADGLVHRDADGAIDLTPRGRELADQVVPAHLDNQARVLSVLTPDEQAVMAGLLRKLLVSLEGPAPAPNAP